MFFMTHIWQSLGNLWHRLTKKRPKGEMADTRELLDALETVRTNVHERKLRSARRWMRMHGIVPLAQRKPVLKPSEEVHE
jgi:hypothetical protein